MADMKPKSNRKDSKFDMCMTPPYAVPPLLELLKLERDTEIWEPAAGNDDLVKALTHGGLNVVGTTLERGVDFFNFSLPDGPDGPIPIITNPPYSIKPRWVERCYELTNDWALLLPVESLASSKLRAMFNAHGGVSALFMDSRVDFKLPDGTWGDSAAQFPTCWVISGFGIEPNRMFDSSTKEEKAPFKKLHRMIGT